MKRIVSMVVCAMAVLMVAGMAMAGEEGKGGKEHKGDRFAKADTDKDGKLSSAEFKTVCKDPATAEAKFTAADTDKDGFLSKEELKAAHDSHGSHGKKGSKGTCKKTEEAPATE